MRRMRAFGVALALVLGAIASASAQTTTVIVVRHAEKAAVPADDPPLTVAGEARARDLFEAIRDAGVTSIITTQFARTKATAQPSAVALGITPEIVPSTSATHVKDVAAAVRRHPGGTVLVVGHSNTVPAIVAALGAKQPAAICDPEYDGLYIVTIAANGKAGVIHSRFGVRTPVDASCATMK